MSAGRAPVCIYTLRPFQIWVDEKPLQPPARAAQRPLQLLKALVALGGEGVPELQLTDSLWPNADGDSAHRTFSTTLHRLRGMIGRDALVLSAGRLSLNPERCWVDAQEAARAMEDAQGAIGGGDAAQAQRRMDEAAGLYRHPFLEGEYEPAEVLTARQRLHSQFLRTVAAVGDWLAERGERASAMALYRKGLAVDDLAEELYQRLMQGFLDEGRLAEGLSLYRQCAELLQAKGGTQPSPQTESLHQSLQEAAMRAVAQSVRTGAAAPRPPAQSGDEEWSRSLTPGVETSRPAAPPTAAESGGGERRQVTVLMCMMDAPAGSGRQDPEEADDRLRDADAGIQQVAEDYGGTVNQSGPGQWMLLFGVPVAHEDDPLRAVRAAWVLNHSHDPGLEQPPLAESALATFRVGIESGLMVVHPGGGSEGRFRAVGPPFDTSTRLAAQAAPGQILVGPRASEFLSDFVRCEPVERGTPGVPQAFRVAGDFQARSSFEAATRRGLTPFTGRERELEMLTDCLQRTMRGEGQFVTVGGEAGIGKSRLAHEFRRSIDRSRVAVFEGRCQSFGQETPYLPFLDALRRGLRISDKAQPLAMRARAIRALRALDPVLEQVLPQLLHLLSIPAPEYALPRDLKGEPLRRALEEALVAVLTASARRQPTVLVLEDWHWADEASDAALSHLVSLVAHYPMLVLVIYRPDYTPRWGMAGHHLPIALRSLDVAATECILGGVFDAAHLPAGLAERIHARTAGNPFFAEEIARSLLREGTVTLREGRAELTRKLEEVNLPDSVQSAIRSRVDRLDPAVQEVLRIAAVIGHEFPARVLERIHSTPAQLEQGLDILKSLDLVHQVRVLPEPVYVFKHVLTQQAVYDSLLRNHRMALHLAVARMIESLYADRIEEHYESLAHHYARSGDTAKAIEFLEKAGDKAAGMFSLDEAKSHYRHALNVMDSLPVTPEGARHRVDLSIKWARIVSFEPESRDTIVLQRSLELTANLRDPRRQEYARFWLGRMRYYLGDMPAARAHVAQALVWAETNHDQELLALSNNTLGRSLKFNNEFDRCIEYLEKGIPLAAELGLHEDQILSSFYLGQCYAWLGRFPEAIERVGNAVGFSETVGNRFLHAWSMYAMAYVNVLLGNWPEAIRHIDRSIREADRVRAHATYAAGLAVRGYAAFMSGEPDHGIRTMQEGLSAIESTEHHFLATLLLGWQAEAHALRGKADQASETAQRAFGFMKEGLHYGEPTVYRALLIAAAGRPRADLEDVEQRIGEALQHARGMPAALALARLRAAEALARLGDAAGAGEHLQAALQSFGDCGMTWWLRQGQALESRLQKGARFPGFSPFLSS